MQAWAVLQDACPPDGDSETQLLASLAYWICRLIERLLNAPQQGSESWDDSEGNFAASSHSVPASLMALHKCWGGWLDEQALRCPSEGSLGTLPIPVLSSVCTWLLPACIILVSLVHWLL